MSLNGFEISYITIEQGWKMSTMLAKYRTGFNCNAYPGIDPFDLVSKVTQAAEDPLTGDIVHRINIMGHGSASGVQIGGHFVEMSNFKDYEGHFRKLRRVLDAEGFVHIRGCTVGQNEKLLCRFAAAFGVPVYAGTSAENILLDFNFGDIRMATPGGHVSTVSRP